MNSAELLRQPVLTWLTRRAQSLGKSGEWDWVPGDAVVGHLSPALYLLGRTGAIAIPQETLHEFQRVYLGNLALWMVRQAALRRLIPEFKAAGIPLLPLKGAALLESIYPDAGLRSMTDIDLLVPPDAFLPAVRVMQGLGYQLPLEDRYKTTDWFEQLPRQYWPKELSFITEHAVVFDLHHALIVPWFQTAFRQELPALWERSLPFDGSTDLWNRCLSPYDTLAYLCLHLALDGLQAMRSFLDVDLFVRCLPGSWDWEEFLALVGQWRIRSAVFHVFSFCRVFMDTPFPQDLLPRLDPGILARLRVRGLITPQALLSGSASIGRRYPTLVKLALIDRIPRLLWTLVRLVFPGRAWFALHPSRRNLFSNLLHIIKVVKRGT